MGRVLALDIGTSSVRALVTDEDARPLPDLAARRPTELRVDPDGRADLDADELVDAVAECIDELHDAGHLDGVELVSASCFWHSVLGTGTDGRPVTPVFTWADTRAAPLVAKARALVDATAIHQRTGAPLHAIFWTAKIPWILEQSGTRPRHFMGMSEYLTARLLDDATAGVSMGSGTGLLDVRRCDWDPEALELAGVTAEQVPAIAPRGWSGHLSAAAARRWPALAQARWAPFLGDGAAANLGAGADTPDQVAVTIGTSTAVRTVGGAADTPLGPGVWRYRVDHDRVISGVSGSGGGNLHDWARKVLRLPEDEALEQALADIPPGAGGVTVLPYHAGSRAPLDLPGGSGVMAGLSLATTPEEIVAATFEGVCFVVGDGYDAVTADQPASGPVLATGGSLSASPWLRQLLANVLDRTVRLVHEPEASARGAAALALDVHSDPATDSDTPPQVDAVAALRAARERQQRFAAALGYLPTP